MTEPYPMEEYGPVETPMRYRDQEGRRTQYDGDRYGGRDYYEGTRGGRWDEESAYGEGPAGRFGQGQSFSPYGQQGWDREQQPGRWTRPQEWSRREQQWDTERAPSAARWAEADRARRPAYSQGARGGPYGIEYPESSYREPGGYGEMYRGEMGRYPAERQAGTYSPSMSGPYSGRGPRGYQRSDERIQEDVCERLTRHPEIDAEDVDVQVRNGEVTLSGSVMDRYQKRLAEDAIEGVSGVRDIKNQLHAGMSYEPSQRYPGQQVTALGPAGGMLSATTRGGAGATRSTSGRAAASRGTAASRPASGSRTTSASKRTTAASRSSSSRTGTPSRSTSSTRPTGAGRTAPTPTASRSPSRPASTRPAARTPEAVPSIPRSGTPAVASVSGSTSSPSELGAPPSPRSP